MVEGKLIRAEVSDPVGSQGNPMSWNEIVTKCRSLLAGGDGNSIGKLEELVANVENAKTKQLTAAMHGLASDNAAGPEILCKVAV